MMYRLSQLVMVFILFSPGVNGQPAIDNEGNVYNTKSFGNRLWMVENLRVSHYNNGDVIETTPADESLSPGVYIIVCHDKNGIRTGKMIKR